MTIDTIEYWRQAASGAIRNITPEQADAVAEMALSYHEAGNGVDRSKPYGVWHAAYEALGWPECHCARCDPRRMAPAGDPLLTSGRR